MKQNWSVSRRSGRRGRKTGERTITSGRDQVGETRAHGLEPLLVGRGALSSPSPGLLLFGQGSK